MGPLSEFLKWQCYCRRWHHLALLPSIHSRLVSSSHSSFDICFLNDIAVANSNLLREYSLIDSRVRDVMIQVKRFCKHHGVNSSANGTISSYSWNILCIFYLQCIEFIPNLQDPVLMEALKQRPNPKGNYWHLVDGLDTCKFYLEPQSNIPMRLDIRLTPLLSHYIQQST